MKKTVALVFGGRSGEHEVSMMSAASVYEALDRDRYQVLTIGIRKDGRWVYVEDPNEVFAKRSLAGENREVVVEMCPAAGGGLCVRGGGDLEVDIVLPVLHGPYGEDGTIQGVFEMAGLPYVGSGVAASAAGMDKVLMKKVFIAEGFPVTDYRVVRRSLWDEEPRVFLRDVGELGYPVFVKPANLGSSVGISRVEGPSGLKDAVEVALAYDRRVIVEQAVTGCRELECSVLGNDRPQVSLPGEIVPCNDFYDYEAKYMGDSELIVPAELDDELTGRVREMAARSFLALDCAGMARVDFLYGDTLYINELNTLPGFTDISMYPKLWQASGVGYPELISRLIELGLKRHGEKERLTTDYASSAGGAG